MPDDKVGEVAASFLKVFPVVIKYFFLIGDRCADPRYSRQEYEVLNVLKEFGPLPISSVGERLSISKSRMTVLVDRLIGEGLIVRGGDEGDRRVISIGLTPQGRKISAAHGDRLKAELRKRFSGLDDEELGEFLAAIECFHSAMEKTKRGNELKI